MDIATKAVRLKEKLEVDIFEIEKIENILFRDICLFAIAEQYAQDCGGYRNQNSAQFVAFLDKYASEAILVCNDPVTLYYRNKDYFDCKDIDLSYLSQYANPVVLASAIADKHETRIILLEAASRNPKAFNKHMYSELIYKYRSKLSHELHSPSVIWEHEQSIEEPFYSHVPSLVDSAEDIWNGGWELRFPYAFLKKVLVTSINAYLDDCVSNNKRPFENYPAYLSWYE